MLWHLWIWSPSLGTWRQVGTAVDGVNDEIRGAVMRGLLRRYSNGVVYASHPQSGRVEKFWSPDGGQSLLLTA